MHSDTGARVGRAPVSSDDEAAGTPGNYVHEGTKQEIGDLYTGGAELAAVAEAMRFGIDLVKEVLADMGIALRSPNPRRKVDPATRAKIESLYWDKPRHSIRQIVGKTGRGYGTVHRVLEQSGRGAIRPRGAQSVCHHTEAAEPPDTTATLEG